MTNIEILTKAIQRAIDGGWKAEVRGDTLYVGGFDDAVASYHGYTSWICKDVFFNHDFAKALWSEKFQEWLGKYIWYSNYEQDSYTFDNGLNGNDSRIGLRIG